MCFVLTELKQTFQAIPERFAKVTSFLKLTKKLQLRKELHPQQGQQQ